jgi:predicted acetyltransferase
MEVRAVSSEEYVEACKVESLAFDIGIDFSNNKPNGDYRVCRAVFDDSKICACLDYFPFRAMLNGSQVGLAGIGGVVSLPEERRKGHVCALFKRMLEESRENGDTLSYLFPFSNVYYRQFGYESCMTKNDTSIPISAFQGIKDGGNMRMYFPGDDSGPLREAYNRFAADKNFMIIRSEDAWKKRLDADPYKNNRYVYVRYNADNQVDGYVILTPKAPSMIVEELIWLNTEALRGILGFLSNFVGRYDNFKYNAPTLVNFRLLIPEPYDVKSVCVCDGMGRIVDVSRALKTLPIPQNAEQLAIKVDDDFLDWNNGTFLVYAQNGEMQVERTGAAPDMTCDVRTLVQLFSGYVTLEDCLRLGNVVISGKSEAFARLFIKRTFCICDAF